MSADSPRRNARGVPAIVPPQVVCDRSIIDSVAGFINDVTLAHQPQCDPKDTITWARFESAADISDPRFGEDWELEGNVAPPLLLILGYGQGVQVWAIPANGEAVEVLSWRHGIVSALRVLPTPNYAENGRADEPIDAYSDKRPLMAICDGSTPAGSNPQFCAVNFVSLKTGAQVKTIKFKNPVLDILANRSSIVITFHERIAVFDARNLEDRLSVTTCFPSPGINPNPVALGSRWMAYSENKLLHSKRSGGGCDGDGVSSYTATVLNAAKSFGKGLRELGEQVAAGLTGTTGSGLSSKSSSFDSATGDMRQPGVVTILDIKHPIKEISPTSGTPVSINGSDPIVAHFVAHSEAVVAMEFDNSGMMLLTADKRGHDFHLFRIQPHPVGSSLAAVHHLYVLHRGDTSAKVQNITFSLDSRWVAVSTLRGTTHVFPITPYGGPAGVRTHTSLHVVNKLSRFHRSAGLTADGRSSSPISHSDSTNFCQLLMPYHNPTLPPFPRPTVVLPLAQLRQPFALGSPPGSAVPSSYSKGSNTRQRLSSLSDDNGKPLSVCAVFAKSRSWLLDPPNAAREAPHKVQRKAVDSLFVMAGHGALIQYDLDTKLATNVAKEKICDDTPIELEVEAKAQWNLGRKDGSVEIMPPLSSDNWLIKDRNSCMLIDSTRQFDDSDDRCDSWLSQVEIITHAGPHRRLWMGPQFVFKTYNTPSGSNLSHIDVEAVEIGVSPGPSTTCRPERSSPLNMPLTATGRSTVPVLIESGSYSSIEQSPKLMDRFRHEHMNSDFSVAHGDTRLKEDLADAMRESPSASHKDTGEYPQRCRPSAVGSSRATASSSPSSSPKARSGGSGGVSATTPSATSATAHAGGGGVGGGGGGAAGDISATAGTVYSSQYESLESLMQKEQPMKTVSIEKVVNPLGTVTTITGSCDSGLDSDDVIKSFGSQDCVIHENCDESLFRPVVAIFCDEKNRFDAERTQEDEEYTKPPEAIGNKLIVPVIEKALDLELTKKESLKNRGRRQHHQQIRFVKEVKEESDDEITKFHIAELSEKAKSEEKTPEKQISQQIQPTQPREPEVKVTIKKPSGKKTESVKEEVEEPKVSVCLKLKPSKELEEDLTERSSESKSKHKPSKTPQPKEAAGFSEERVKKFQRSGPSPPKTLEGDETKPLSEEVSAKEQPVVEAVEKKAVETEVKAKKEVTTKRQKSRKSEEREISAVSKPGSESKESWPSKVEDQPLKSTKAVKAKETADEEVVKTSVKSIKPLTSDDLEDEKPIEFKRMTATSVTSSKGSHKFVKPEKTVPQKAKEETKAIKTAEKKVKIEKGSSVESTDSIESRGKAGNLEKTAAASSKSRDKPVPEGLTDPVQGDHERNAIKEVTITLGSKKKTKLDSKKPSSQVTGISLAVELSNASDLADSMLDFQQDKNEAEDKDIEILDRDDNGEEKKSNKSAAVEQPAPDNSSNSKSEAASLKSEDASLKSEATPLKSEATSLKSEVDDKKDADKDLKKQSKIPKQDKCEKLSSSKLKSDLVEAKDCTDSVLPPLSKFDLAGNESVGKDPAKDSAARDSPEKDSATRAPFGRDSAAKDPSPPKEKKEVKSETLESAKSKSEVSADVQDSKSKSKTKKTPPEVDRKSSSPKKEPSPEPKSTELSTPKPMEAKPKRDKLTKLLELSKKKSKDDDSESDKPPTKEKSPEIANKITIEPIKVDTFLTDLMDSQKATKSKGSPTESNKSEESPKKLLGSPLKFVDTFAEASPPAATKKDKSKKKSPPETEMSSDKPPETSSSASRSRVKPISELQFFDKFAQDTPKSAPEPMTPWKSVASADDKPEPSPDLDFPSLGKAMKSKKSQSPPVEKQKKTISFTAEAESYPDTASIIDDLPSLQPLEPLEDTPLGFLSPLPPFEPLDKADENISLINFESPLQEAAKPIKSELDKSETTATPQFPKGFPTDTIIFALCGSLHYENENSGKPVDSPLTLSFSDSTAHTTAEYKSLTENDDQYLSLEQSSQENAPSTSSSTCDDITEAAYSSGGSDKTAILSGKSKNKQRRKKQLITSAPDDDEELRPLISKGDEVNLMTCSLSASKRTNADEATATSKQESLPSLDNNQTNSDSSSSDQATTSEDPDDQICLNVHAGDTGSGAKLQHSADKAKQDESNPSASVQSSQQSAAQAQHPPQQSNSSKKKLKRRKR